MDTRRGSHHTNASSLKHPGADGDHLLNDDNSSDQSSIDGADNEQITPLPKVQMLVISILLFSEPLTSTILFPFIYFMIKDFHLSDDEKEIGAYAGWITSVFFVAQFCTAIMWGRISDRYGRRPVLLVGLVGNSVSSCLFGLSKTLWWAIASRALCGIMNGNSGVARSMVSEITDNTNKAKAFSIFGFCWGTGMIVLGGYLARPAEQFPDIFGGSAFFTYYPYFLPCFVSACGSMIGFVVGYFYLKESNPTVLANKRWDAENEPNERTALLTGNNNNNNNNTMDEATAKRMIPKSGSMRLVTRTSFAVIIAYSIFGFHAMVFEEVLPLYFTAPVNAGGLGITRTDFAKTLSFFGVIQLIFQFGVYPRLTRHYSILDLCRFAFLLFLPVYFLFPELSTLRAWVASNHPGGDPSSDWTFRLGYLLLMLIRYGGVCSAYTGMGIMVSTSAAPEILGTVNG
ncbi:major facilitator superfamily domain-containing protein [Parasitella parasitica]|nr:major facilitator superfamily domain-containing protein [Parasitella parasitica]